MDTNAINRLRECPRPKTWTWTQSGAKTNDVNEDMGHPARNGRQRTQVTSSQNQPISKLMDQYFLHFRSSPC
eukprot:7976001-Lingulodinium_polyedra.AAC.1